MSDEASGFKVVPAAVGRYFPATILAMMLLGGCQARLDLSGVLSQQSRPVQRGDILQAAAANGPSVVAVGAMGVVITSEDGGTVWQRTIIPGKPFLIDVSACPSGDFFAIDNTGTLWTRISAVEWVPNVLSEWLEPQALSCDESGTLWLVGGFGTIMSSADGGGNWESFSLEDDVYLTTIQFVDALHGYVTGEFGTVLHTADHGTTWQRAPPLPDDFYPQAAWFTDEGTGWVVGLSGTIWHTGDRGRSWRQETTESDAPLYGVTSIGEALVAVGDNGTILYRPADKPSWFKLGGSNGTRTYLRGIVGLSGTGFVAAGGGMLITSALPRT
jgi:photosystem II stability/assembly factor-like uncharacterized protein